MVGAVAHNRDQLVEPVSQQLAILHHHTPVLPISEVVLTQVGARNHHTIVKHVRLHMVHSKDLPQRTIREFAFQHARIRIVVETNPHIPIEIVELQWTCHFDR